MSNLRNSRGGRPIPGAFNAEFTPGQMVIGICIFLFAMIASFGAGILVARMDPSFQKTAEVIDLTQPGQPTLPSATKLDKPATPPASTPATTPATPSAPTAQPPAAQAPVPPLPPAPKEDPNAPRRVELPAPSAPKSSNKSVEVPVSMPPPVVSEGTKPAEAPPAPPAAPTDSAKTETTPAAKTDTKADTKTAAAPAAADLPPLPAASKTGKTDTPAETATKTEVAKVDPKKTGTTPTDPKKGATPADADLEEDLLEPISSAPKTATKTGAAKTPATTEKPAATTAPAGGGTFGIQVGAFPGANREAQAAELKKRVDAAGLGAEVRPSKDKQYYRVLVVGYKDRAAAIKALSDLKQRPGFEKAFVQDLSKL